MSDFGSLQIGQRGLAAAQMALNIAGQNVANANTDGYSRKRVETSVASRKDTIFGEMGYGVNVDRIIRFRDQFLDQQIREQVTQQAYFEEIDGLLERVENIFNEPSEEGLNAVMSEFWNSWQDLANNPEDVASREVVRSTGLVLIDHFKTTANNLLDLRDRQNNSIEAKVEEINGITAEIFNLNHEVSIGEVGGGEANDSRDRRDFLVEQLSALVDVNVVEDDQGRYTITTAGNVLVGPSNVIVLELQRSPTTNNQGEVISEVTIRFADTKRNYEPRDGALKAIFDSRDVVVPKYTSFLDEAAASIVTFVNEIHYNGYNLKNTTGVHFFDPEKVTADSMSLSSAVFMDAQNVAAAKGGVSQLVNLGSTIPPAGAPVLDLAAINPDYRNLSKDTLHMEWNGRVLEEGAGKDYVLDHQFGQVTFLNYALYSAGDAITMSFRYNDAGFPGPGDGSNALDIAELRYRVMMGDDGIGNPTKSIGEFYSGIISVLGIERNQAKSAVETRNMLIDQFENRKQDVSGVSLDEELANMIKFEHSYQASARFISMVNSLLETLLNL